MSLRIQTIVPVGALAMVLLMSASCSMRQQTRSADRTYPSDAGPAITERPVPINPTGAGDNKLDSERIVGCADQKGDMTASPDCRPENRPMAGNPNKDARQKTVCRSHADSKGNIIYDDPSCPTRGRQPLQEMGSSYENVALTRESAYFDRYIEKAVKHAREAETAGSQGNAAEMFSHTELSLSSAKEAQRAGNVPGLSEGIMALRETLAMPLRPEAHEVATRGRTPGGHCATHADVNGNMVYDDPECPARYSLMDATNHVREARILLSQAAGINPKNTRLPAAANARTLDGQLIRADAVSRADGRGHYVLREGNGTETPVWFTPDVLGNMQSGDYVRAQVDADGRVIAIRKI